MASHKRNHQCVTLLVKSRLAQFTQPSSKIGGEKRSYSIPTYSSLQNLFRHLFPRPSIYWVVDECRVLNRIKFEPISRTDLFKNGVGERYTNLYLADVAYVVKAHYEINQRFPELNRNFTFDDYNADLKRAIQACDEKCIYLGTRECECKIYDASGMEFEGYYDESGVIDYGVMFHSFVVPSEGNQYRKACLWNARMVNGVIKFPRTRKCEYTRVLFKEEAPKVVAPDLSRYRGERIDEPRFISEQHHRRSGKK